MFGYYPHVTSQIIFNPSLRLLSMINFFNFFIITLTMIMFSVIVLDKFVWNPERIRLAEIIKGASIEKNNEIIREITNRPNSLKMTYILFPLLIFVLFLRSFFLEIYNIPTASMEPNFKVGSSVLINKISFGVKDPLFHRSLFSLAEPKRNEVVVFQLPDNPGINFIKRVVGLPGDLITYKNKKLRVNPNNDPDSIPEGLPEKYKINIDENKPDRIDSFYLQKGKSKGEWVVPEGHFFVIGDNRDNSQDSRFWGFVPKENLVGKVIAQW